MKFLWRILNSEAEWGRFMREKYFTSEGEIITSYRKSSILPGLKWVMEDVKQNSRWLVRTGEKISVWKDVWIKDKPLCELFPEDDYINNNMEIKVEDLINNGQWLIPHKMLDFFQVEELPVIENFEDKRVWTGTLSGEFSVSSATERIRSHCDKEEWAKKIWHHVLHPTTASNVWIIGKRNLCFR